MHPESSRSPIAAVQDPAAEGSRGQQRIATINYGAGQENPNAGGSRLSGPGLIVGRMVDEYKLYCNVMP